VSRQRRINEQKVVRILEGFPTPSLDANDLLNVASDILDVINTPDHWAESVKMADEMGLTISYDKENQYGLCENIDDFAWIGLNMTLPELHEKLISLRESEGE
jgi:hypothetical protein